MVRNPLFLVENLTPNTQGQHCLLRQGHPPPMIASFLTYFMACLLRLDRGCAFFVSGSRFFFGILQITIIVKKQLSTTKICGLGSRVRVEVLDSISLTITTNISTNAKSERLV